VRINLEKNCHKFLSRAPLLDDDRTRFDRMNGEFGVLIPETITKLCLLHLRRSLRRCDLVSKGHKCHQLGYRRGPTRLKRAGRVLRLELAKERKRKENAHKKIRMMRRRGLIGFITSARESQSIRSRRKRWARRKKCNCKFAVMRE